jgi:hypothetical protein
VYVDEIDPLRDCRGSSFNDVTVIVGGVKKFVGTVKLMFLKNATIGKGCQKWSNLNDVKRANPQPSPLSKHGSLNYFNLFMFK